MAELTPLPFTFRVGQPCPRPHEALTTTGVLPSRRLFPFTSNVKQG